MADQLEFKACRNKATLLLLGSIGFVALGGLMLDEVPLVGWICIGFFGLGVPISLVLLCAPGSTCLRLDNEGFELRSWARRTRIAWSEVEEFRMDSVQGTRMIAIVYTAEHPRQRVARALAAGIAGMEGGIANIYAVPLDEILKTLSAWRARSLALHAATDESPLRGLETCKE